MDVQIEEVSPVKKILHIEVSEDKVREELDNAYQELRKTANLKGFRPGKIPRTVLEQYFGKQVNSDITAKLIQESYVEIIKDKALNVIGLPTIDPKPLNGVGPLNYDAVIEVYPELENIDYKGIKLKKNSYAVSDTDVERQLVELQQKVARQQPLEENRPTREDDLVIIDFEGQKDGVPQLRSEKYGMKIGKSNIDPVFDQHLVDMNIGEQKTFTVQFPEDHAKLSGAEVSFTVTLKEIRQEILPEINDDFAKLFGGFASLEEFKQKINETMKQGLEKRSEQEVNEQIFKALLERVNFQTPQILIEHELNLIIQDIEHNLAGQNSSLEKQGVSREMLRVRYWDTAMEQAKRYVLLKKLIEQEHLELSESDMEAGMQAIVGASSGSVTEVKEYYAQNQDQFDHFKYMLLEKKMMRRLIDSSDIEHASAAIE